MNATLQAAASDPVDSERGVNGLAAVGKEGWVYLTDDQGDTWRRVNN